MKLKSSFYNEVIPIAETDEFLLYNILTGGLNVISSRMGHLLEAFGEETYFKIEDYPECAEELHEWYEHGFIVEYEIDEKQRYQNNYLQNQSRKFRDSSHIGITVGTTILCNMGCPYCFETVKPNKTLRDQKVINGIIHYIEDMIHKAPVQKWSSFSVTWFGGEPLINKDAIESLSTRFITLADKYNIPYSATIITNGILLDKETWQLLKQHKVTNVQVTIDGAKEVHDKYRPLKKANGKNYEKILENLSIMPLGMQAAIRVNTDKRVAATFHQFLDDLYAYGLWPQRYNDVSVTLAWLRAYKNADTTSMINLTQEEFFAVQHQFSELQVNRFNKWAGENGMTTAKVKWRMPEKQSDCATYVSPYFFTFDPEGNIHKCWETVHDDKKSSGAKVFQQWNQEDFEKYISYSRTKVHPVCYNCKFNPVCEGLSCAYDAVAAIEEKDFPCTPWKNQLKTYFKDMYLHMKNEPDKVALQVSREKHLQTHSNK